MGFGELAGKPDTYVQDLSLTDSLDLHKLLLSTERQNPNLKMEMAEETKAGQVSFENGELPKAPKDRPERAWTLAG